MNFSEFLRVFEVRAQNLNWFLGAGCSVSAGIPSAKDITWDCKSRIYCSENGVSRSSVSDITDLSVQRFIQDYLDSNAISPQIEQGEDEYSYYFERAISSSVDRQSYIQELMKGSVPSYGHLILAGLAKLSKVNVVWTTNFDKLFENAVFKIFETTNDLVIADLGDPEKAKLAMNSRSYPLLVKLHGDFHSQKLKNTENELQKQDAEMREALYKASLNDGFCVVGYSGRDNSIMNVFKEAAKIKGNFPHGIFWFKKLGEEIHPNVEELIEIAVSNDIEAKLIEINNFDEMLNQIKRYIEPFPVEIEDVFREKESRLTESLIPQASNKSPYLRINALKINAYPTTCKLVESDIDGGYKLIQEVIEESKVNIIARRIKKGVIAFGQDQDIKAAFRKYQIKRMQLYGINQDKLEYPSEECKLIFDALTKAIELRIGLKLEQRRDASYLIAEKGKVEPSQFNSLVPSAVSNVAGIVPNTNIKWVEACEVKMEYRFNSLWVVLSPRTLLYFSENDSEKDKIAAKSFIREKTAPRWETGSRVPISYNQVMGSILAGWISLFKEGVGEKSASFPVLGLGNDLDPVFEFDFETVISGRLT